MEKESLIQPEVLKDTAAQVMDTLSRLADLYVPELRADAYEQSVKDRVIKKAVEKLGFTQVRGELLAEFVVIYAKAKINL